MDNIFNMILELSISSSVLIIFVLFIRIIFKKQSKSFFYYLWILVFIKLITPFSFEVERSFVPKEMQDIVVVSTQKEIESDVKTPEIEFNPIINQIAQNENSIGQNGNGLNELVVLNDVSDLTLVEIDYRFIVWGIGAILLLGYFAISLIKIKKSIKFSYKYRRNIYISDEINVPFVFGVLKPIIYLPEDVGYEDRDYIIKHENEHIKRLDYIIKPLCFLITIIHWFNPLVWISYILISKDMEMSCDEKVVKKIGYEYKKDYSRALLNFAIKENSYSMVAVLFAEKEPEKRIMNILKFKAPKKIVAGVFAVIIAVLVFILFTNEKQPNVEIIAPTPEETATQNTDIYNIDNVKWQDRNFVMAMTQSVNGNAALFDLEFILNSEFLNETEHSFNNLGINKARIEFENQGTTGFYSPLTQTLAVANLPLERDLDIVEFYHFENLEQTEKYEISFKEIIPEVQIRQLVCYEKINDEIAFLSFIGEDGKIYVLKETNKAWELQSSFDEVPTRSIRFMNENIGFMSYLNVDDTNGLPNIKITYDGGKTFNDADFSNTSLDEDEVYDACCMYIDSNTVIVTASGLSSAIEKFMFTSKDYGQTWEYSVLQGVEAVYKNIAEEYAEDNEINEFIWPTTNFRWSRGYTGEYPLHSGIDLAAEYGTDIVASKAGVVETAELAEDKGNYLVIKHDNGVKTLYAHCSELIAKVGDEVEQGEVIAKVGSTGNATGNHVHFEVILEDGTTTDPLSYLP